MHRIRGRDNRKGEQMRRKWLAVGIILLFLGTCIIPTIGQTTEKQSESRGTWLYVGGDGPGNYSRIQDAIDNASEGDTVFVYDDSSPYYENIVIDKKIRVIGEDKNSTVIDARNKDHVVEICTNHSSIEYFTLQNTSWRHAGIKINSCNDVLVRNNIIRDCYEGIVHRGSFCEFSYNFIQMDTIGIESEYVESSFTFIHHNIFQGTSMWETGVVLRQSKHCIIANNMFKDSELALMIWFSVRNRIYQNTFLNNKDGIFLQGSCFNVLSRNSFIGNDAHAYFETPYLWPYYNRWVRNYWDDLGNLRVKRIPGTWFFSIYPGEESYINKSNFDWHPAQEPYDIPGVS